MNKGKYVFSQLLDFLDRNNFNYLARKYGGDRYIWVLVGICPKVPLPMQTLGTIAASLKGLRTRWWPKPGPAELITYSNLEVYSTIICYCLTDIVREKTGVDRSIYEILKIASILLTDTAHLRDLFGKLNYNNVNEFVGST